MAMSNCLVGAVLVTLAFNSVGLARSRQPSLREQQEHACANDAMALCKDAIPDEAKITACMAEKRAQLSAECGKVFDAGTKPKKHGG